MKTIKYLLFILFCSCATLLYSQVESTYYDAELSSDSIEMVANSLREQIDQWKQKVKENPKDEKAWMQYAGKLQSLKGISLLLSMKPSATLAVGADIQKEFDEMMAEMKQSIPNTATYEVMRNMNIKPGEKRMPIEEIIDKWPDAILHYPTYMSMSLRDEKRLKDICVRWYQSGEFPAQILNFAYNELASADKDAIIFMGGSLDLYGARMLQNAKDMFNDKKIIVYPFLSSFTYMDKLTEELGIPKYKEENNDTTGFISPTDFMQTYSKKIKRQVDYIIRHTNRPVYFSITMDELSRSVFKDCLHSEGLLCETFYPETVATVAFNPQLTEALSLYYVPALKALLQFYKESGDLNHYDKLYLLLKSVIDNAKSCSKEVWEQYQKSINLQ